MTASEFQNFVTGIISMASGLDAQRVFFSENSMMGSNYPYIQISILTFGKSTSQVFTPGRKTLRRTRATVSIKCKGDSALDNANKVIDGIADMEETLRNKKVSIVVISEPENRTGQEMAEKNISRYDFDLEINIYNYVSKERPKIESITWEGAWQ